MRRILFSFIAIVLLDGGAKAMDRFSLPAPGALTGLQSLGPLWATEYHVHVATASQDPSAIPLADKDGNSLGVSLSHKDWCDAAMEGTVVVRDGQAVKSFNAGGLGQRDQTDCSDRFHHLSLSTQKNIKRQTFFHIGEEDKYGLGGTEKYRLIPFRSIAVDRSKIPWGTALYIPGLRGAAITLPDGSAAKHDGYVYAVDKGGQITGNHIDFFEGLPREIGTPVVAASVITSNPARTFSAYIVQDDDVVTYLRKLHVRYGD